MCSFKKIYRRKHEKNAFTFYVCDITIIRISTSSWDKPTIPRRISRACFWFNLKRLSMVAHRCHGTNKNLTAQTKTSRHKRKRHGTNENVTAQTRMAQTKASRHKQEPHGTKMSRHKLKVHATKQELHGTKQNFMAQEQDILHFRCEWRCLYI